MSYLEMRRAPIPDMSSGIISVWFREVSKQQEFPPDAEKWPQDFWTEKNAAEVMVPPNAQYSVSDDPAFKNCVLYWNAYGLPPVGLGSTLFGNLFLGAAACWIPNTPPTPLNTLSATKIQGGFADVDMSKYGIRTLITFGNPEIDYEYHSWRREDPEVIDSVYLVPNLGIGPTFVASLWPPPYRPYILSKGDNGHFHVANYRLDEEPTLKKNLIPQSFIGIDNDGHIVINLQTKTKAEYKGMSFEMTKIEELQASATFLQVRGPPFSYTQIGFPFPDGDWVKIDGYWNGYQFEYKDISEQIMGVAPESFLIYARTVGLTNLALGAPIVKNGGWHHLLFSFDISGEVEADETADSVKSECMAWMAFDDVNITGVNLQNRPPCHDGFTLPKLRGTVTTQVLDCGPCTTWGREAKEDNWILPRNAWLRGWAGPPRDGLPRTAANAFLITADDNFTDNTARLWGGQVGDFNWMEWTGSVWPLYGHGIAPGPWQATFDPMHPTVPDPKEFDKPSYRCSKFIIPVQGHPIGIPAGIVHNKYNTGIEMAELQLWANKKINTKLEGNRRLFVDKEGKPVDPSEAEKVLGIPDILLHGSGNWKTGFNTGSAGYDRDVEIVKPAGQFVPVAAIEKFTPDPILGQVTT